MKNVDKKAGKELYQQLRELSCAELWNTEVPRFNQATPEERLKRVAVIRAVGVVFAESGKPEQLVEVRKWLHGLLNDPAEKVRRYAMTALPKLGAGAGDEAELLKMLRTTPVDREKKFLGKTLEKIGGAATLAELGKAGGTMLQTEQKVRASVARWQQTTLVRLDRMLEVVTGLRIHLRGRRGLEAIVRDEVEEWARKNGKFRVLKARNGVVVITPSAPFTLGDIYQLRCFDTVGFVVGTVEHGDSAKAIEATAAAIASPSSLRIFKAFTHGAIRYRLEYAAKGHQRGAVREVANRAYALCPEILNDARQAPWAIEIHPGERGDTVELCPQLSPDPRFAYRQEFVPAASHPPLAACLARLAGKRENEVVWDPFCGSGVELIERALLGGVRQVYGTDRSAEAIAIAERNFAAANSGGVPAKFTCCDFREAGRTAGLGPASLTLVISNPPLGKRVPIPNLRGLMNDLFMMAAAGLRPGGRLVFANPIHMESPNRLLKLQSRQVVDFGGFDCRVEVYRKME